MNNKVLTRTKHGIISGTLAGFAEYYGLRKSRLRLVFFILAFTGVGVLFYFLLWISIPSYSQRETFLDK